MTARNLLVRGLLVGLLAGIAAFLVAHQVGEPSVERAISLEESTAAPADASAPSDTSAATDGETHVHEDGATHTHSEDGTVVSRGNQRTWGLLTGTLAVGTALGGILALVAAAAVGRLGSASPRQSTAVVALVGFVSVALVPFLKYPATPPAVGSADTIGARTSSYFLFLLLSVVVAVVATLLALRVREARGSYVGLLAGGGAYVVVMAVLAVVLPTVDELGDFPASTLWSFRVGSLLTLTALWGVLGIGLTGLVGRLGDRSAEQARRDAERRAFAASL